MAAVTPARFIYVASLLIAMTRSARADRPLGLLSLSVGSSIVDTSDGHAPPADSGLALGGTVGLRLGDARKVAFTLGLERTIDTTPDEPTHQESTMQTFFAFGGLVEFHDRLSLGGGLAILAEREGADGLGFLANLTFHVFRFPPRSLDLKLQVLRASMTSVSGDKTSRYTSLTYLAAAQVSLF